MPYQYKHAVLGGTFDHLHAGHKHILTQAFAFAKHITIGITSDDFVKGKKLSGSIQPYEVRTGVLKEYLLAKKVNARVSFEELHDIYGSAATRIDIDAIIVTSDSEPNAHKLNKKRSENNRPKLYLMRVPLLTDTSGMVISSSRIRQGIINRKGKIFMDSFSPAQKHSLPQKIREQLQSPIGHVVTGSMDAPIETACQVVKKIRELNPPMVIAVGDIVVQTLKQAGFKPQIEIIDYRTRRSDINPTGGQRKVDVINPAGTITKESIDTIESALQQAQLTQKSKRIIVQGEEDLLALPAILLAPLCSVIIYGQFDQGIVIVEADEKMKENVSDIIKQFE